MQKKIIAIFGGSFNPPINSHVLLAKQVLKKIKSVEKIIFVPVSTKYKKENLIEDKHRYNMLKIICNKEDQLEVSSVELDSKRQLYTVETLDYFKRAYKENDIYFIIGTDNLKEFDTWKSPDKILQNYKLIVLERDNDNLEKIIENNKLLSNNKNSIIRIDGINRIDLSSTMIREKIKNRENVEEFIDRDVWRYIQENKLYL